MRLVKHGLEECKFKNTCNNHKSLSEIQLEHENEDELVVVVVKVDMNVGIDVMVVKEIEDGLLEEMEVSHLGRRIFKTIGLRWVPTGRILTSNTTKVDNEPPNGSNEDITNQYECAQTLVVSAGTLNLSAGTSFNLKEGGIRVWLLKSQISHKPGLQGIFN
nr:hypothetical protein [Tanacetum cinerariifolium]